MSHAFHLFIKNPLKIIIYDPVLKLEKRVYVILGNIPRNISAAIHKKNHAVLKEFYGPDYISLLRLEEIKGGDDDDFDSLFDKTDSAVSSNKYSGELVKYIEDINVYGEDKFSELKEKIFLITKIPAYRQYLYFYADHMAPLSLADIKIAGNITSSTVDINAKHDKVAYGIPLDQYFYDNRNNIVISPLDTFMIVGYELHGTANHNVYIVDIEQYFSGIRSQINTILQDTYIFNLIYYGFVIKFWPQFTKEVFREYITNMNEIESIYPNLAKNYNSLTTIYEKEKQIIDSNIDAINNTNVLIGITNMILQVRIAEEPFTINIRNLFDQYHTSHHIPCINAYIDDDKYLLRKNYANSAINFPSHSIMRDGLTMAIVIKANISVGRYKKSTSEQENTKYIFFNIHGNGACYVKASWNEEDIVDFNRADEIIADIINPEIDKINSFGNLVMNDKKIRNFVPREKSHTYKSLNICMFWKKLFTVSAFKIFCGMFDNYYKARIISPRSLNTADRYSFVFRKGMKNFDHDALGRMMVGALKSKYYNGYIYLTDQLISQKWAQNYEGRLVEIYHRATDIKIEIKDVQHEEFLLFKEYILNFILKAGKNAEIIKILSNVNTSQMKTLKKLLESDPMLYGLKKHGSNRIYSKLCQSMRQPMIYSKEEVAKMSQKEKDALTKYWNFTYNRDTYYGCKNSKYPVLSFITGVHPLNYCLPCCSKKKMIDSKGIGSKSEVFSSCMQNKTYKPSADKILSRHVMSFGKDVAENRVCNMPNNGIKTILNDYSSSPQTDFYIVGVNQGNDYNVSFPHGFINSVAKALQISTVKLTEILIKRISNLSIQSFSSLANGKVVEYMRDKTELVLYLRENIMDNAGGSSTESIFNISKFTYWIETIIDLLYLDKIVIFMISHETVDELITELTHGDSRGNIQNEHIIIFKNVQHDEAGQKITYYPIVDLDARSYFSTEHYESIYLGNSPLIQNIYEIIELSAAQKNNLIIDLKFIELFVAEIKGVITNLYVNRKNSCYAVDILYGKKLYYVPINYSKYSTNGIKINFTAYEFVRDTRPGVDEMKKFIGAINTFIKTIGGKYNMLEEHDTVKLGDEEYGILVSSHDNHAATNFIFAGCVNGETDKLLFNYHDVNNSIMKRLKGEKDKRTECINESLYRNYIYRLLMMEFYNVVSNDKNIELRNEIKKISYSSIEEMHDDKKLLKLLKNYPEDYQRIQQMFLSILYDHYTRETELEKFDNSEYKFDKIVINNIRQLNIEDARKQIMEICKRFTIEDEKPDFNKGISFSNIYTDCNSGDKNMYCKDKKLIVYNLAEFVEILTDELLDDFKSQYIFNNIWTTNIIDKFVFEPPVNSLEMIRIIQLK